MRSMTSREKFALIREHGSQLARVGLGIPAPRRNDVLESAQRIVELAKSIPKIEWAIEE